MENVVLEKVDLKKYSKREVFGDIYSVLDMEFLTYKRFEDFIKCVNMYFYITDEHRDYLLEKFTKKNVYLNAR